MSLAQLIRDNQPCVALTGAGVSTESGIPDFRSPTGLWARFDPLDGAPRCDDCLEVLKPDVVFFGELLPEREIDRAFALAREARFMLVVGSSLEVHPAAGLPFETLAAGGKLAIVNRGPTPLDARAALKLDGSAGEILSAALEAL